MGNQQRYWEEDMKWLTITIVPEHCQLSVEEGKITGRWVGRRSKVMSSRVENCMYWNIVSVDSWGGKYPLWGIIHCEEIFNLREITTVRKYPISLTWQALLVLSLTTSLLSRTIASFSSSENFKFLTAGMVGSVADGKPGEGGVERSVNRTGVHVKVSTL